MRFQQETETMQVEQLKLLKLLKGRFEPKTLVAGKRGRPVSSSLAEKTKKLGNRASGEETQGS